MRRRASRSCSDRDPRDRPGNDRHDVPRRRRASSACAAAATASFAQHFPQPGWVEHDPEELWSRRARRGRGGAARRRRSGPPSSRRSGSRTSARRRSSGSARPGGRSRPAIVWQDRRTAERCRELPAELIRERDRPRPRPLLLGHQARMAARADRAAAAAELAFGTVDTWLVWKLTGGRVHATDRDERVADDAARPRHARLGRRAARHSSASTAALLPAARRARRRSSARPSCSAPTLPIAGIAGDQQAALFGHGCFAPGEAKATYGTGASCSCTPAPSADRAPEGLLDDRRVALGGGVRARGRGPRRAARRSSGCATGSASSPTRAESEALGAPRRVDGRRRLRPGPRRPRLAALGRGGARARSAGSRAARRGRTSSAPRSRRSPSRSPTSSTCSRRPSRCCGPTAARRANGFLMQFQADLLGCPVEVAAEQETTALGAAALAGRAVGLWPDDDAIRRTLRPARCTSRWPTRRASRPGGRSGGLGARPRASLSGQITVAEAAPSRSSSCEIGMRAARPRSRSASLGSS